MDCSEPGPSGVVILTRNGLFDIMIKSELPTFDKKIEFMEKFLIDKYCKDNEQTKVLKHKLSILRHDLRVKWQAAGRNREVFEKNNSTWLKGTFTINVTSTASRSGGRPEKCFLTSSERTKRRKTEKLRSSTSTEMLAYATQMKLRESGDINASYIIKDITKSPTRAVKYREAFKKTISSEKNEKILPLEALYMYIQVGMSREYYEVVRSIRKKLYPCYSILQKAKKECLPPNDAYIINDTKAEIVLQDLLDLTAKRLLIYLRECVQLLSPDEKNKLQIIYKWGCDGSQQIEYNQKFENEEMNDSAIFQSSLVPLQLVCTYDEERKIIWQNPVPSSPRYCRPIRIRYIHESVDVTNEELTYINGQIDKLKSTILSEEKIIIKHKLLFTMVGGKVCNAVTHTASTMRCYICGATSKEFNDLTKKRPATTENLEFGLSILHARIRFFEGLLHLSYKLSLKKWQVNKQDRTLVDERKKEIQNRFWNEMSLKVDVPRAGYGNSNDGNTSRRFFADYEKSAEITGIDVNLIYRFKVILEEISSGYRINLKKFSEYTAETEKLYVQLYEWCPMTPTIHKILRHGVEVIKRALLPIGLLSEEAAEARNKHFREYRRNYARKFSRTECNMDVLNRLLLTSDPVITGMRPSTKKKTNQFSKETLEMLLTYETSCSENDDSESESKNDQSESDSENDGSKSSCEEGMEHKIKDFQLCS